MLRRMNHKGREAMAKLTRDESEASFLALRAALPRLLNTATGEVWTVRADNDPGDHCRYMRLDRSGEGLSLSVSADHWNGTGRATYIAPQDHQGRVIWGSDVAPWNAEEGRRESFDCEAKFTLAKTPEQIAKDIVRRVLPRMTYMWPHFAQRIAAAKACADQRNATLQAFRDAGLVFNDHADRPRDTVHVYFKDSAGHTYRAEINEYGHVRMSLDIAPDVALRVIAAVRA